MTANTVTACGRWLVILLFLVAIGLPGLTMLLTPARDWSEREKRKLAEPPALPRSATELPRFFAGVDAYLNDHFGFRGLLVSRYQREMEKRFNRSGAPGQVHQGLDGWLFYTAFQLLEDFRGETPLSASQLDQWLAEQAEKEAWLRRRGVRYLLAAAPNKQSIYPEKLMAKAPAIKGTSRFEQLEQRLGGRLPAYMVDLHTPLRRAKGDQDLYYKHDTHWNVRGAYLAFGELFQRIGALFPDQAFTTNFAFGPDVTSYGGNRGIGGDLAIILQRHLDFKAPHGPSRGAERPAHRGGPAIVRHGLPDPRADRGGLPGLVLLPAGTAVRREFPGGAVPVEGLQPGQHGGDPGHAQAGPGAGDQGGAAPVRFGGAATGILVGFSRCPAKSKIPAAPATCSCRACSLAGIA